MMNAKFSRNLAVFFGFAIPLLGIVRHWSTLQNDAFAFFIDLFNGGFLLYGAWRFGEKEHTGQRYLSAAWGFTCAMFYSSLLSQIDQIRKGDPVAAPLSPEWVAAVTGVGLFVVIVGLITSLRSIRKK